MQDGIVAHERAPSPDAEESASRYVHQQIEAIAALDPGRCALRHGARSLSRAELTARAKHLARRLLAEGIAPGSVVAVRLDRSFDQIIAMLGVLHAGCAFMSIDPADPPARANSLIDACAAAAVITDAARAADHDGMVLVIDDEAAAAAEDPNALPLPPVRGSDLAYIIHTSGSTGRPNGVEITHASLCNLIQWTNDTMPITPADRTSHAHGWASMQ
jgi:non-ribosomal peptide synthetase component F